jgi:hypothetical protein
MRLIACTSDAEGNLSPIIRRAVSAALRLSPSGSDACSVVARATGHAGGETVTREFSFSGRREAQLTGLVAADTARLPLSGRRRHGVVHLEQFADARSMLERLQDAQPGSRLIVA